MPGCRKTSWSTIRAIALIFVIEVDRDVDRRVLAGDVPEEVRLAAGVAERRVLGALGGREPAGRRRRARAHVHGDAAGRDPEAQRARAQHRARGARRHAAGRRPGRERRRCSARSSRCLPVIAAGLDARRARRRRGAPGGTTPLGRAAGRDDRVAGQAAARAGAEVVGRAVEERLVARAGRRGGRRPALAGARRPVAAALVARQAVGVGLQRRELPAGAGERREPVGVRARRRIGDRVVPQQRHRGRLQRLVARAGA